ncbi:MAG: KamA family radical SAM protein [Proteobacteria bacterium]|jgi:lysine 2,3-aminomutase|nr:KamA family radical SAM protein [Pseudomonadota bacterium]
MGTVRVDTVTVKKVETEAESEPPPYGGRSATVTAPLYAVETENSTPLVSAQPQIVRHQSFSPEAQVEFRRRFFPKAKQSDWNNWHWQMRNRIHSFESLERFITLTEDERAAFEGRASTLPLSMTPYYLSLLSPEAENDPIRRCIVPRADEWNRSEDEDHDPLGEESDSPMPGLVHRYPDRVLFLATNLCSTYCRYCTRSRIVGLATPGSARKSRWARCINYIRQHTEVRDVLISGGDPLTLSDDEIDWLLNELRAIEHVEILRIGTKVPAVMPQRVTDRLISVLRRYHPLFLSLHFTHPAELTPDSRRACEKLADAGIPLGSQTVLLKGINDDIDVMKPLFHGLLKMRVRPYYLYQCDRIPGSAHFKTPVSAGLEIIRGLRGHTTGYAIPQYVIDAPNGGGKIPLLPHDCLGRENGSILLRNYTDRVFKYPDSASDACDADHTALRA